MLCRVGDESKFKQVIIILTLLYPKDKAKYWWCVQSFYTRNKFQTFSLGTDLEGWMLFSLVKQTVFLFDFVDGSKITLNNLMCVCVKSNRLVYDNILCYTYLKSVMSNYFWFSFSFFFTDKEPCIASVWFWCTCPSIRWSDVEFINIYVLVFVQYRRK